VAILDSENAMQPTFLLENYRNIQTNGCKHTLQSSQQYMVLLPDYRTFAGKQRHQVDT